MERIPPVNFATGDFAERSDFPCEDKLQGMFALDTSGTSPAMHAATGGGVGQVSDAELVEAVLARDRKAIAVFVERFSGKLYRYVRHRLAPQTDPVEDVVQDAFVSAWRGLGSYRGESALESWLLSIARHKVEDYYRRRLREGSEDAAGEDAVSPEPPLDLVLERARNQEKTQMILRSLPEPQRLILLWRYWHARPAKEIAAQTGKTEKAVERMLARARAEFKRRWLNA